MLLLELGRCSWWLPLLPLLLLIFCTLARGKPSGTQLDDVSHLEPSEWWDRWNNGGGGLGKLALPLLFLGRSRAFCGLTRPAVRHAHAL